MTLPPDPSRAGLTLFEVLVALAVLSLMTGVVLVARPVPSPELRLNASASTLMEEAARTRHRAVQSGTDTLWAPDALSCSDDPVNITFFPDGTAETVSICLTEEDHSMRLEVNVLSGRLTRVDP